MVKDLLSRVGRFHGLGPRVAGALDHAASGALAGLPDGLHELAPGVAVQLQHYDTRPDAEVRWEAHRAHIDLQLLLSGREHVGVAPIESLQAEPYDEERDLLWLNGSGDVVLLESGQFLLLWPEDGHRPGIAVEHPERVRKAVYKIAVLDPGGS